MFLAATTSAVVTVVSSTTDASGNETRRMSDGTFQLFNADGSVYYLDASGNVTAGLDANGVPVVLTGGGSNMAVILILLALMVFTA